MKTNRIAVSIFFLINGFLYANWISRLPEIQQFYGISNSLLGTLLLCSAAGAIVAMPFSGLLTVRFGSRTLTAAMGITFCLVVPLLPLFTNLWIVGALFFFIGILTGALDVSMNGQAVYVERMFEKPIMSSFHAVFSIGMALGAGSGALFAKFQIGLFPHFLTGAILCLLLVLWAAFNLVNESMNEAANADGGSGFRLPTKAILPLGIIAFCGMTGEGSMADWSAIYMNKVVGMDEAFSALAFGSFSTAMTIGRIFGDYFTARLGRANMLLLDTFAAILGLSGMLLFPNPYIVLIALFIIGLGLATVVPIIYSAAGNTPGVAPSVGIAMATTVGYAGFFVGPPTIGYLADAFSLRIGLVFSLILFIVMLILIRRVKI
ncbi:MAG: MFS transporter [Saprospiraceae bacterium]